MEERQARKGSRQGAEEIRRSVEEAWPLFVEFLGERGARVTAARRIVLERVFSRHDHFCAGDLAADLTRGPDRVSRGTVYRTLALMEEAGLVRVIRDADVHAHYEHAFNHEPHEHMICDACGRFIEFSDPALAQRVDLACRERDFRRRSCRIVVFGTCAACRAKEE